MAGVFKRYLHAPLSVAVSPVYILNGHARTRPAIARRTLAAILG